MELLNSVDSIISHCFLVIIGISSAYFYFHWYLKGSDTYVNASANTNIKTGTTIY